jgi:nucleoside-diphosphate-sugar epimerase
MKHTILGAGGAIGNALAFELLQNNVDVRLVSRSKFHIYGTESVRADICSYKETLNSVKGSDIVYLCLGLPYESRIWAESWPIIMQNTIDACKSVNSKLVFFDNVYMYGKVNGRMTEATPYNPCSKKGETRAIISMMLEKEISRKNIDAIIARSADLYGPYSKENSILFLLAIKKLINGKRAQWLMDANVLHSFTYTIDAAKGLILLAGNLDCYNKIWHLPTAEPVDGETLIHMTANLLGISPDYTILNKWAIYISGLFSKTSRELAEMLYQYEYKCYFDSMKFNDYFNYKPKTYREGIRATIEYENRFSSTNTENIYMKNELVISTL